MVMTVDWFYADSTADSKVAEGMAPTAFESLYSDGHAQAPLQGT
jgi:hypothetical protein